MDSNNKVLIIAYRFPPMGGVGSRRWAKFSKYLAVAGWDVHVFTTEYPWIDRINWCSDIENTPGITVIRLKSGYPCIFMKPHESKWVRACIRIIRTVYDLLVDRKSRLDYASAWTEILVSNAVEYIRKHGIKNVIVSGPPSSLHLSGALIKSEVPFIRLIQDYRDPWSNVHDYAMRKIKSVNKVSIMHAEALGLQAADKVVVVTKQMGEDLRRTFAIAPDKIEVIHNGYDSADFLDDAPVISNVRGSKIRIGYFGSVGRAHGRMMAIEAITAALHAMDARDRNRFEICLYSDLPTNYFSTSEDGVLRSMFRCYPMVCQDRLAEIIRGFDVCLAINGPEDGYAIASKIYDYMGASKTMLLISPPGDAYQLLAEAGQYVADYNIPQIQAVLKKILTDRDGLGDAASDVSALYSNYDLRQLSTQYAKLLA